MELEIAYDSTTSLRHYDAEGLCPTSATLSVMSASGATVASPTVALPSLSTTVTSATPQTLTLAAVTGLRQGSHIATTCDGVTYVSEITRVDGSVCHLAAALPLSVDTGSPVKHIDISATIPAGLAIGPNYRLVWAYTDGTQSRTVAQAASVVRWLWTPTVSAADVAQHMAEIYSDSKRSLAWCQSVANDADQEVRSAIAATGRRAYLYGSSSLFRSVGLSALRYVLAVRGICHGGQVYEAQKECRFALQDGLSKVLTSLAAYDSDASGTIDAAEAKPLNLSIRVVR